MLKHLISWLEHASELLPIVKFIPSVFVGDEKNRILFLFERNCLFSHQTPLPTHNRAPFFDFTARNGSGIADIES